MPLFFSSDTQQVAPSKLKINENQIDIGLAENHTIENAHSISSNATKECPPFLAGNILQVQEDELSLLKSELEHLNLPASSDNAADMVEILKMVFYDEGLNWVDRLEALDTALKFDANQISSELIEDVIYQAYALNDEGLDEEAYRALEVISTRLSQSQIWQLEPLLDNHDENLRYLALKTISKHDADGLYKSKIQHLRQNDSSSRVRVKAQFVLDDLNNQY